MDAMKKLALVTISLLAFTPTAIAASAASKNKTGNRLFEQGKFQDAEKAYLDAQASMPGRPELSYNLGNSLIKQRKYEQALQALAQAIGKGDKGLQARGHYNIGNALFDMGKWQESAQSYIRSLRLNPADMDAKHNLELALKRMQEQKQEQPKGQGQAPDQGPDRQKPEGGQKEEKGKNEPHPPGKQGQTPESQTDRNPANPQSSGTAKRESVFSKERALQILDAMQNQELAEQRRLLEHQARKKATGRDW